jgi:hypothetical protein
MRYPYPRSFFRGSCVRDLTYEPRTLLRLGGETKTGRSPETPFIVSRTNEPKPTGQLRVRTFGTSRNRAPFRLLSTRAPRQAVLRASFWLSPWLSTRPCDLPEDKTRDASDQLLPPIRSTCTRTSCVPGSLHDFHRVDTPRSLGLRAARPGYRVFSRHSRTLRRVVTRPRTALPRILVPDVPTRGFRAWALSSHGACYRLSL